jgi:hypothetical protein
MAIEVTIKLRLEPCDDDEPGVAPVPNIGLAGWDQLASAIQTIDSDWCITDVTYTSETVPEVVASKSDAL